MPDQLRADAVGAFGNPVARTPNIDALAARGTRFTNAYSQHSVCSQSRISIFTGWYPHVAGHRTLTNLLKPWEPNLLRILRDAGYHVAWAGHRGDTFAPGVLDDSVNRHGFAVKPSLEAMQDLVHHTRGEDDQVGDKLFDAYYVGERSVDGALDLDEATVLTAVEWLAEGLPEPWVLFVALMFPHPPFTAEEPWFSLHPRADVTRPAVARLRRQAPVHGRAARLRTLGPPRRTGLAGDRRDVLRHGVPGRRPARPAAARPSTARAPATAPRPRSSPITVSTSATSGSSRSGRRGSTTASCATRSSCRCRAAAKA